MSINSLRLLNKQLQSLSISFSSVKWEKEELLPQQVFMIIK